MFLKRLDIIGFKSFADKTSLEFSPGITGVVGPNGSGKSNIADAIRWVLGEQSARSLRGSKMEDIIFAGTEKRKPINYCEVSLTLDNSDQHLSVAYAEVTVTRRVYRSGEGEYFINQQPCRLRDVHELFMDSGLGREAYSIIGQGRIEEMLSTRPEDRRGPFEDAAGIVKYKARRKESERRLDETCANLLRVDDVLAELERQAGPLEENAKRAREYQALSDRFTELDITLLLEHIRVLRNRHEQALIDIDGLQQRKLAADEQLKTFVQTRERSQLSSENTRMGLEARQQQLLEAVEERERTDGQMNLYRERLNNIARMQVDRGSERESLEQEVSDLATRHEGLSGRLQEVTARLEQQHALLQVAAEAVNPDARTQLANTVSSLNADLIDCHQREASLRNQIRSLEESITHTESRKERWDQERERLQEVIDGILLQLSEIESNQAQVQSKKAEIILSINEDKVQLRELSGAEATLSSDLQKIQSEQASLRSKAELLKELEDGYDGYGLGVKSILHAADQGHLTGVHGSLASLIRVEKSLEVAIETALGAAVQNIVVETEADARKAIDYLKRRQAGRATFMPLQVIKSRRLSPSDESRLSNEVGYLGLASDLVQCDSLHQNAVLHLLGNVVVAKTLVDANRIAQILGYRVRIVTEDGDVVSPGGTMSGGSQSRRGPGLLGRKRDREEIEGRLIENQSHYKRKQDEQAHLRQAILDLNERVRTAERELSEIQANQGELDGRQREYAATLRSAQERFASLDWDGQQLTDGYAEALGKMDEAREALAVAQQQRIDTEALLEQKRSEMAQWDSELARAQERLTTIKVDVASLQQEHAALSEQREETIRRLTETKRKMALADGDLSSYHQATLEAEKGLHDAEAVMAQLTSKAQELENELVALRLEREATEASVREMDGKLRLAQEQVQRIQEQLHRAEVSAERIDVELNHALERLGTQYRMTYEWAIERYPAAGDVEAVRREAESVQRRMASLGTVQLGSIEEWDRLSERINFLVKERTDLRDAEAGLRTVIADIDDEMARRFLVAFEQIRHEFEVAFRQLFQGGRADLQLTDADNVLHSGIEVIAQPPGKKLQNLNLMSGGERALTAMALLFAILRVRPVPFCVLDEVEAALDEANVGRFASQLRRFAQGTQFIVITHRRGTMEEVDSLYGVTMQESGVSGLVSVRLSDEIDGESA